MIVTERDERVLNANYLHWEQLTDEIAIVTVEGKEMYFDPGERMRLWQAALEAHAGSGHPADR